MKIALVFPRTKYICGDPPLGVIYLATYLMRKTNVYVKILDTTFEKHPLEYVKREISKTHFDLIGISIMTTMYSFSLDVARQVKKISPDSKVIFGGPHSTILPEETLSSNNIDAVAIGEGESTLEKIVRNGGSFESVPNVIWKKDGKVIRERINHTYVDLDQLPFPDRDLVNIKKYFEYFYHFSNRNDIIGTTIIASRGCPYQCSYCQPTLEKLFGKKIRRRSPENIVEEIKMLRDKYGLNTVLFEDDTFILDKNWVINICNLLQKESLSVQWSCNLRANLVSEELIVKMKESGLVKIYLGIESANNRILNGLLNKGITIEGVEQAVEIIKKHKLLIHGFFMLGSPSETKEEINKTIRFARQLNIDDASFNITTPLPGTYLYEGTKDLIDKDFSEFDYYKTTVYKKGVGLSQRTLNFLKKKAIIYFYLTPKRLVITLKPFFSIKGIKRNLAKLRRF